MEEPRKPANLWRRLVKWALIALAVLVAGLLIAHAVAIRITAARLEATRTKFKSKGCPMEIPELIPPAIPPAENAAKIYKECFDVINQGTGSPKLNYQAIWNLYEELNDPDRAVSEDDLATTKALFKKDQGLRRLALLLTDASIKTKCEFTMNFSRPLELDTSHLVNLQRLGQLLWVKVYLDAEAGNSAGCLRAIQAIFRLAERLEKEPLMLSQLVRLSLGSIGMNAVATVCERNAFRNDDLKMIPALLARFTDNRASLLLALDADRLLFGEALFDTLQDLKRSLPDQPKYSSTPRYYKTYLFRPALNDDHRAYLDCMLLLRNQINTPLYQLPSDNSHRILIENTKPYHLVTTQIFPVAATARIMFARSEAQSTSMSLAIKCELYRLKHGRFPAKLEELIPDYCPTPPVDPFSGRTYGYGTDGNTITVYSVGPDRKDDGGSFPEDIGWRLAKPN